MKKLTTIAAVTAFLGALSPSTVFAGLAYAVLPEMPVIDSPSNESTGVSVTPELSASTPAAVELYIQENDIPVSLVEAEWLFYKPVEGMTLLAGAITGESVNESIPKVVIPTPIAFSVDGTAVAKLGIFNNGEVIAYADSGEKLGSASVLPAPSYQVSLSASKTIIVSVYDGSYIVVTWPFASNSNNPNEWEGLFQVIIDTSIPSFGYSLHSFTEEDFDSPVFNDTTQFLTCGIRINDTFQEDETTISHLADIYGVTDSACYRSDNDSLAIDVYDDFKFPVIEPDFKRIISTSNTYTLDASEALESGTSYDVIVRYVVTDNETFPTLAQSPFSAPVSFTTAPDTAYSISLTELPTFTAGETQTLTFSLENTGPDAGAPQITVSLPFSIVSGIAAVGGGELNTALNAQLNGADGSCNAEVDISGAVIATCTIDELAAGESLSASIDLTFSNASSQVIGYNVCETLTDDCNDISLTEATLTVVAASSETTEEETQEETEEEETPTTTEEAPANESSGSSGGGSSLWLTLLALPLLRLRLPLRHRRKA